jgi:hypothetical protein
MEARLVHKPEGHVMATSGRGNRASPTRPLEAAASSKKGRGKAEQARH